MTRYFFFCLGFFFSFRIPVPLAIALTSSLTSVRDYRVRSAENRLFRVVEDDPERVASAADDRADAVPHGRAEPAAGAARGTVAGREDHHLALLGVEGLAPRLGARPLLDEQEIAALVVDATTTQERGDLQREGDV